MEPRLKDKPDVDKAKNIVCALVHLEGGKFKGKTRLNKAFWRAHVYHYRHHSGLLSKYPIARLPEGPGIDDLDEILFSLEREGRVKVTSEKVGTYLEVVVSLTSSPPSLESDEEEAVKEAIRWVRGKSAAQVANESHRLSLAWKQAKNGEIIDLAFDALDTQDLKAIEAEQKSMAGHLEWAKNLVGKSFRK